MDKQSLFSSAIISLIVFQTIFTGYMAYGDLHPSNICVLGKSCEQVQDTKYGQIFGIKLPFIAFFAFIALLLCYLFSYRLFLLGSLLGFAVSLTLIYIQTVILKMVCINCLMVDVVMILIFSLALIELVSKRKASLKNERKI